MQSLLTRAMTGRPAIAGFRRLFGAPFERSYLVSPRGRDLFLNTLAIAILTLGYAAITGTNLVESDAAKIGFRAAAIILILLNVVIARRIKRSTLFFVFVSIVLALVNGSAVVFNLIFLAFFFESFRRMPLRDAAFAILIPSAMAIAFHQIGLLSGVFSITETEFGGRLRSGMGFRNPNQLAVMYLSFVASSLFFHLVSRSWGSLIFFLVSLAVSFSMLKISDSRTSMLAVIMMIAIYLLWRLLSRVKGASLGFRLMSCLVLFLVNFMTWFFSTAYGSLLNEVLSLRPMMVQLFLSSADPLGYMIGWQPEDGGVDNSYLMLFSAVGAPLYFLLMISLMAFVFRARPEFSPVYVSLMIVGLFEGALVRPEIPAALLFLVVISISTRVDKPSARARD
jgi:hypothetical protein